MSTPFLKNKKIFEWLSTRNLVLTNLTKNGIISIMEEIVFLY